MLSLKGIQAFQTPNNLHGREFITKKSPYLLFCKATDSSSNPPPPPQGDLRKQELLVKIAMLQAEKMQLTEYLDERSDYLTQFAEEATVELDQIGENALKELDQASSRIMDKIESQMQAFEDSAELNRQEIEESERKITDFETQMEKQRNEGLFFKNLTAKTPLVDKAAAKDEMEKIKVITKENAGSEARRNVYIALIIVLVLGISNALLTSSSDLGKFAVFGLILVGLFFQLFYEQRMLSEIEKTDDDDNNKKTK